MDTGLVLARLAQYLAASGLFGGALFLARQPAWATSTFERALLVGSAAALATATLAALVIQAANMAGASDPLSDPSAIAMVLTGTSFGSAVAARMLACLGALAVLAVWRGRRKLWTLAALGAVATVTLAWGGHGAAEDGAAGVVHLIADGLHLLAAALWIGALGVLLVRAAACRTTSTSSATLRLHDALKGFSGVGTLAVAVLILTGLINGCFLVGPTHLAALATTLYGRLLLAKLVLFVAMAALAAVNRWRLTPQLGVAIRPSETASSIAALQRSLTLETGAAGLVLAAVAWLGTLAPPTAG